MENIIEIKLLHYVYIQCPALELGGGVNKHNI